EEKEEEEEGKDTEEAKGETEETTSIYCPGTPVTAKPAAAVETAAESAAAAAALTVAAAKCAADAALQELLFTAQSEDWEQAREKLEEGREQLELALEHFDSCMQTIDRMEIVNKPAVQALETRYLPAPRFIVIERSEDKMESGIGIYSKGNDHFVGTLVKDSPADRAGVKTGDRIYSINGTHTGRLGNDEVLLRLGPGASSIDLLILEENAANLYKELNMFVTQELPNVVRGADDATAGDAPSAFPLAELSPSGLYGFYVHLWKEPAVHSVVPGSYEDRAGLKAGTRIVGVDDVLFHSSTPVMKVVEMIRENPKVPTLWITDAPKKGPIVPGIKHVSYLLKISERLP
ncbi:hypothetical protein PFISCL1PPCAC_8692, partial [Pristionchus fissidentatus]